MKLYTKVQHLISLELFAISKQTIVLFKNYKVQLFANNHFKTEFFVESIF